MFVLLFCIIRIFNELTTKIRGIKEFKEKLLLTLGAFLDNHFPLPEASTPKKRVSFREDSL
jgi:centromere protein K